MQKSNKGFTSKFGFLMATVGSAVGLGNLWSFPYRVGEGGGAAFVFIYVIMVCLVGVIAMIGEFVIGKRSQVNVIDTYGGINKWAKWLGYLGVIVPFMILCYYQVIGGWSIKYMIDYIGGIGVASGSGNVAAMFDTFTASVGMPVLYLFIFAFIVAIIVLFGVNKGIEKASKILMPALFVCLVIVVIKGLTLPNATLGLEFLFKPDFSKVNGSTVLSALGQVFFSMSLGMGINVAYGSYMKDNMKIGKSAVMVGVMDTFIAMLAGMAIFPAVFSFDLTPTQGPGLIFVVLAKVFASMGPVAGRIFGAIFFMLVILAAITSSIALLEVPVQFIVERFHVNRKLASLCIAGVVFGIGAFIAMSFGVKNFQVEGVDLLTLFDSITNKIILPVTASSTCLLVGFVVKPKNLMEDLCADTKFKLNVYKVWGFLIRYVTPIGILCVLGIGINEVIIGKAGFETLEGKLTIILSAVFLILIAVAANGVANYLENKRKIQL
ncbi:MAG: sodium-dependent transporter [Clostridia bacterium]|nr:sodium-dependent transporter [Clostridia bacterium]